ncbi:MAG: hypothetical protein QM808_04525 [Steroidobacteraceae bacterium]
MSTISMKDNQLNKVLPRLVNVLVAVIFSLTLFGCQTEVNVIETTISSDGQITAQLVRTENFGPGQHSGQITVRLKRLEADDYMDVAIFIDDNHNNPTVKASWLDARHLNIEFMKTTIGFQAVKVGDVSISYHEIDS